MVIFYPRINFQKIRAFILFSIFTHYLQARPISSMLIETSVKSVFRFTVWQPVWSLCVGTKNLCRGVLLIYSFRVFSDSKGMVYGMMSVVCVMLYSPNLSTDFNQKSKMWACYDHNSGIFIFFCNTLKF